MHKLDKCLRAVIVCLGLVVLAGSLACAAPFLKSGDRVVFYGDSITEQRLYTRYIQQYIYCRYPELNITFFNAGWSGDRANGALNRLERDVLFLKPTVVTLFFGMNDGSYVPHNQGIVDTYGDNMDKLIRALLAKNIRVVVYAPGAVDYDSGEFGAKVKAANYNEVLQALGATAKDLATTYNLPFVDVNRAMLKVQEAEKAEDPKFTMIPDSVHPDAKGQMVMAAAMLKGLGAEPMPALGEINVESGKGNGLKLVSKSEDKVVLETTKPALTPFWFADECQGVLGTSGFLMDMATPALTVKGLTGAWKMSINGDAVGGYGGESLAAGIQVTGKHSLRGKSIHDLTAEKENAYFTAWREERLGWFNNMPDKDRLIKGTLALDKAFTSRLWDLAAPHVTTIVLERAK